MDRIAALPPVPTEMAQTLPPEREVALRTAAESLEASFLAEMLRHSGVADARQTGGGGAGEEAFAGFLADAYGTALAEQGGIGLAEKVFEVLLMREQAGP